MTGRQTIFILIAIMTTVSLIVAGFAISILYNTALKEEQARLMESARSHARLIEAVARFNIDREKKFALGEGKAPETTLELVVGAHERYEEFGKTGEFTLARLEGDRIVFLIKHENDGLHTAHIPFDSKLAEPMRRALSGMSGTLIGIDYRGVPVLAAHEPVAVLDLGIVTKINLSEIRAPFMRAILIAAGITIVFVFVGSMLFIRVSRPMIQVLENRNTELQEINNRLMLEIDGRKKAEESLKHLASIIEFSDDAIISEDLNGVILSWNKGAERIYGYRESEVKGRPISILIPPDRPNEIPGILERIKNGERVDHYGTVRRRKDGSLLDISLTVSPLRDASGRICGASVIARDFTRQKRTEKALRESEQRFRTVVENSLTGLSIVQDDRVVFQNPEQERLFGALPRPPRLADIEGLYPDDVEKVKDFYHYITSGKVETQETTFRFYPKGHERSAGNIKWVHCRASMVKYFGREAILVNAMDITRSKELEQLLLIQDKMASLGRVATGIAHEIRNPLSGINIYLNTLEKIYNQEQDLDKVSRIIRQLQSASNKIECVIKRVIDFSKPSPPQFVLADINQPIQEAIALSSVSLRKKGISIRSVLAKNLLPSHIDPHLIEEVILNLINNAAEAMKNSEGSKEIEVVSSLEKEHIHIRVCDSGPGIPSHLKDKIFDPFFTTKNGGTGIGLSLSYRIIKDHGGSLEIAQSRWGGAEFAMTIPLRQEKGR